MPTVKALFPSGRVGIMGRVGQFPSHKAAHHFVVAHDRDNRLRHRFGIILVVDTRDDFVPKR